ncbi:succinate-semialdehyde dehydrogenase (NADP(+)) [Hoyosella rhizosphaerae]|uniref:succinate-semialdehyde dehydrogenase (NADP(+)) n=1 Tax=Hoyosella rhizosphaerae TaxID=1755582 RepID=A0A916U1D8_9ACTN|nr:succinic semialdehyde dehydrogenase [Hoyosella rhizosphaerae]MBN4927058.1 succinate-semialdehyde dehydrogenase (NADP(+)) [Hoyosella rhizosphaerae]GGC54366.1 putative succinate-semialdehyde dehydrogenase [NADP(+)] [Hoyosella rhizosphaerae]
MAAPSTETFDRLAKLIAIDDVDQRETREIREIFTGQTLAKIPIGTAADARTAVDRARIAQKAWAAKPAAERAAVFSEYYKLVLKNREALMDMAQAETGKARVSAQEEVLDIALNARYYAKRGAKLLAPRAAQGIFPGLTKTIVRHIPKGVVGVISPWNYPMTLAVSDAIPALIAGNAVVIKPDSNTPYCALACADLLYQAGLPKELFAVVPGPGAVVGGELLASTDYVMFTGSTETGKALAQQAAERLVGFSAELGGKNAMIVTEGADLAKVASAATRACFSNSGQLCISIERIYVEQTVADEFMALFAKEVNAMKLGAEYKFGYAMGSMVSQPQLDTVRSHVEDAVSKGATVVAGGKPRPDLGPLFHEPTVLTGVTEDMVCANEETFGPLVSIYPVATVDEAIARANDTEYGLNASVWAATTKEGEEIAARIHAGTVNVNEGYGPAFGSTDAPMGGMGTSGMGRRHGSEGLLKYTEAQTVATQRLIDLGGPSWLPSAAWSAVLPHAVRALSLLPGR